MSLTICTLLLGPALALSGQLESVARVAPQPTGHTVELGVYGGAFLPSGNSGLMAPGSGGRLDGAGLDFALRLAYLPVGFLGAEAEAGHVAIGAGQGREASLYTLRGHLIAQLPGRYTPFLLGGAGILGLTAREGEAMSGGPQVALHWGVGLKQYLTDAIHVRLEARHLITEAARAPAHHFEILAGISFALTGGARTREPEVARSAPAPVVLASAE